MSDETTPQGLNVSDRLSSNNVLNDQIPNEDDSVSSIIGSAKNYIYCAEDKYLPDCSLTSMRTQMKLVTAKPIFADYIVQFGGSIQQDSYPKSTKYIYLQSDLQIKNFVNSKASRKALLVTKKQALKPEHILYAFYRGTIWMEVTPPNFDNLNLQSEIVATQSVRTQIHTFINESSFFDSKKPEALIIGGDWLDIPYRFARSTSYGFSVCPSCDNGYYEYSSDVEYANLDGDIWGQPEIPVGRLMGYDRTLASIQSLIGVLSDEGIFENSPNATYLDLFPSNTREINFNNYSNHFDSQNWLLFGPLTWNEYNTYRVDKVSFFNHADFSDKVVLQAHGAINFLGTSSLQLNGSDLAVTAANAHPAFWFISACGTVKYADPRRFAPSFREQNGSLLSGLQSRLVMGSMMSVEIVAQGSTAPFWSATTMLPGRTVGENLNLTFIEAIKYYRGAPDSVPSAPGLPQHTGGDSDFANAWMSMMWIGDPLTLMK